MAGDQIEVDPAVVREAVDDWFQRNTPMVHQAIESAVWSWLNQNSEGVRAAIRRGAEQAVQKGTQ